MDEEKGKGHSHIDDGVDTPHTQPDEPSQDSSILARVAASASGLTRSTLATPNRNELSNRAAALANAGKGHPTNSRGNSAWAESSSSSNHASFRRGPRTFRTSHSE